LKCGRDCFFLHGPIESVTAQNNAVVGAHGERLLVPVNMRNFSLAKIAGKRAPFRMVLGCGERNTSLRRLPVEFLSQDVIGIEYRQ